MQKIRAFTLIELLVVITIIGILAVGGIQIYTSQMQKSRDSNRVRDLNILNSGMIQFELDTGNYYKVLGSEAGNKVNNNGGAEHINVLNDFRSRLRVYISNIDNIYDVNHGKRMCLDSGGGRQLCGYSYTSGINNKIGFKFFTTYESESNACLDLRCIMGGDGGSAHHAYETGRNLRNIFGGGRVDENSLVLIPTP